MKTPILLTDIDAGDSIGAVGIKIATNLEHDPSNLGKVMGIIRGMHGNPDGGDENLMPLPLTWDSARELEASNPG